MKAAFAYILLILLIACKREPPVRETVLQLRDLTELATTEYTLTKVVKASDDQTWYKMGERRILISCKAVVKAGVDLSELKDSDLKVNGDGISMRLPPAKVLSMDIRPEDIKTEFQEVGMFRSEFTAEERNRLMQQAEARIREQVPETGILRTAEANASLVLGNLLQRMGYKTVDIGFGPAGTNSQPLD
jgi:hypothetical protein